MIETNAARAARAAAHPRQVPGTPPLVLERQVDEALAALAQVP